MGGRDAVARWLAASAERVHEHAAELTDLDRAIGDADHGTNLDRGFAAVAALEASGFPDAAALLKQAGMTLVSTVGGASGPLWGTFFLRLGRAWPGPDADAPGIAAALQAGLDGVAARGKAEPGDKTMLDALAPAVEAFAAAAPHGLQPALDAAAAAAASGRDATAALVARKGRASYLGPRSVGHLDPGAASTALLFACAAETLGAA